MARDYCDVTVILDRSFSMASIREATVGGLNDFIGEQQKVPGDGCWTLVQFDDPATALGAGERFPQVVFEARPQSEAPRLDAESFRPRGGTALIDAVCLTIDATGSRLSALPEASRPNKVLVVILTDGQENASRQFTRDQMNEKIAHQRSRYNWQFLFLGANQDAIEEAAKYGIPKHAAMTYQATAAGTAGAFNAAHRATRGWKLDGNPSAGPLLGPSDPDVQVNVNVTTGATP